MYTQSPSGFSVVASFLQASHFMGYLPNLVSFVILAPPFCGLGLLTGDFLADLSGVIVAAEVFRLISAVPTEAPAAVSHRSTRIFYDSASF